MPINVLIPFLTSLRYRLDAFVTFGSYITDQIIDFIDSSFPVTFALWISSWFQPLQCCRVWTYRTRLYHYNKLVLAKNG